MKEKRPMGEKRPTKTSIEKWGLPWHAGAELSARLLSPMGKVERKNGTLKFDWPPGSSTNDGTEAKLLDLILNDGWDVVTVRQAIMPRFLYLADAPRDEEIEDFAKNWGPLWWSGKPAVPFFRPGIWIGGDPVGDIAKDPRKWKGEERCSLYRSASWAVTFLTKCALGSKRKDEFDDLQDKPLWKSRIGEPLVEGIFGARAKDFGPLEPHTAMKVLNRLMPVYAVIGEQFSVGKLVFSVNDGFLPVVAAETVKNLVETPERYLTCDECGRLYFREGKMPKPGKLNYCERCSQGDRGSKRAYARRKRLEGAQGRNEGKV